jgi:hypothetical protein
MVAPQASSVLGNAENIALVGIAHNALLGNKQVMALILVAISRNAGPLAGAIGGGN